MSESDDVQCPICGSLTQRRNVNEILGQSESDAGSRSVAELKIEITALKKKWSERWWHDKPNNGAIQEQIEFLEKMVLVIEDIERRMPPNAPHEPRGANDTKI